MDNSQTDHLPPYRVRPRFLHQSIYTSSNVEDKLREATSQSNTPCKAKIIPGFATLYLPEKEQHYWSPQLSLSIEANENGCELRGLYGPRPAVWTMFVFFYALIAFAVVIVSVIGFSNMSIEKSGAILWLVPVLILLFLSLYLVAWFGQRLGHDQMVTLHQFLEECLQERIE